MDWGNRYFSTFIASAIVFASGVDHCLGVDVVDHLTVVESLDLKLRIASD